MLVIVMENNLLPTAAVCKSCPMASQSGLPRWRRGRLGCGRPIEQTEAPEGCIENAIVEDAIAQKAEQTAESRSASKAENKMPVQYECAMGFRIAKLSEQSI